MGFSRQEYWSGLSFPSAWELPDPGIEPRLPHCRQTLYHLSHQGSQRVNLFPPCFEPGTFRMLGEYDNHYSTERILKWVATSSSRRSFWPRNQTCVSSFDRQTLYHRAIGKPDFLRERYNHLFSCRMSGCEFPSILIIWMFSIDLN